jgi:23S rRNA (pseudouridine1915-N3)-methyltransferase
MSIVCITTLQHFNHILMKITLLIVGKTEDAYLKEGIDKYLKRLKHYVKIDIAEIAELKNTKALTQEQQKAKEAELILKRLSTLDYVILLDEKGAQLSSPQFAAYIDKKAIGSVTNLVFIVGGPYGFDDAIYQRANDKLSLSRMTFSHQMVRLFFVEQLYRAFTIIKGEPYHHE